MTPPHLAVGKWQMATYQLPTANFFGRMLYTIVTPESRLSTHEKGTVETVPCENPGFTG